MFGSFPKSTFEVVAPDGTVRGSIKGVFDGKMVVVPDSKATILAGDELRRRLPNGTEEAFEVVDPKFFEGHSGAIPAHYQVDVRRKGAFQAGQGGNYNVHVSGINARVNIGSHDQSRNVAVEGDIFGTLIAKLQSEVTDGEMLKNLVSAVEEMKQQQGKSGFAAAYQKFVSLAADHLGIITPFLPAFSKFFGA
jgi:hypothetical protein